MSGNEKTEKILQACKVASIAIVRRHGITRNLEDMIDEVYQYCFLELWSKYRNKDIPSNGFLNKEAKWRAMDCFRESAPITRSAYSRLTLWECSSCGYKTNKLKHYKKRPKGVSAVQCVCGKRIVWESTSPKTICISCMEDDSYNRGAIDFDDGSNELAHVDDKLDIADMLRYIPLRNRRVVMKSYLEEMTLLKIGVEEGRTESRMAQLRAEGLGMIQDLFESYREAV